MKAIIALTALVLSISLESQAANNIVLTSQHSQVSRLRNGFMIRVTGPVAEELQTLSNTIFGASEVSRSGCLVRDVEDDNVANCKFPLISCAALDACYMTVYSTGFASSVVNPNRLHTGLLLILNDHLELPYLRHPGRYFKNLVSAPANPNGGEGAGTASLVIFDILADGPVTR